MEPADSIRKHGFRRWYERQLIESHLYFVSCFLGIILIAIAMEEFSVLTAPTRMIVTMTLGMAGFALTIFAWMRYLVLMRRSERISEHATCSSCGSYGKFNILETSARRTSPYHGREDEPADAEDAWLKVRCRKCGTEWTI